MPTTAGKLSNGQDFNAGTQTCTRAAVRRVSLAVIVDDAAALIGVQRLPSPPKTSLIS